MNTQQLLNRLAKDRRRIALQTIVLTLTMARIELIRHSERSEESPLTIDHTLTLIRARSYALTGPDVPPPDHLVNL